MSVVLRVDWCSYEAAKYAVTHWHYSGKIHIGKLIHLGVWEDDVFVGAVVYGPGASPSLGKKYELGKYEVRELIRIALRSHVFPVSQIVSESIKRLKLKSPQMRLIVSFADTAYGHHGGIYQAMNWIYTGMTEPSKQYLYRGRWVHSKSFSDASEWGGLSSVNTNSLLCKDIPGKHRYLYPLDRAMRKQISPLAKPYPKRKTCGQSVEGDTSGDQPEEAGSTPAVRSDLG